MADFDPVEIRLDLVQNIDSEGEKATKSLDDIAAASNKMKAQFEKDITAQKVLTTQLIKELNLLKETMGKKVETGDEKQIIEKQKLAEQIELLNKKLIEQEALLNRIGKTPTTTSLPKLSNQVGDYSRQVNYLKMSMTQISREMPNFAISPMIGIMSLSNNLPMIQGDITRMIELNKQLKASGEATIPVWKQLGSALFSWQTALIAGISALMLWGPAIGNWISGLFRAKDGIKLTNDELKGLNESLAKGIGTELGKMNQLFDALKDATKGTDEYYNAKRGIIKQYGGYLQGLDAETAALEDQANAQRIVRAEIIKTAKEKAMEPVRQKAGEDFSATYLQQYEKIRKLLIEKYGGADGEKYAKLIDEQLQKGEGFTNDVQYAIAGFTETKKRNKGVTAGTAGYGGTEEYTVNEALEAIDKINGAATLMDAKIADAKKRLGDVYNEGGKPVDLRFNDEVELLKKNIDEAKKKLEELKDGNALSSEVTLQTDIVENMQKRLDDLIGKQGKPEKEKKEKKEKEDKPDGDLAKIAAELQQDIDASTIAAMQEGTRKKLKQVEVEFEQRKSAIAEKLREIEKIEKVTKTPATEQRNLLGQSLAVSTAQYEAEKQRIEAGAQQEVDAIFADVNQRFTSRLQNQLNQVDAYYEEQLQKLRKNISDNDQLEADSATLYDAQLRERSLVYNEHQLNKLEFEEQVALKRQEISNRELLWEADKQKRLLEIQLEYAMKKLRLLNDAKINGGDVDEEINQTRELIGILSGDIASTAVEKFSEIADAIVVIGDAVADFIGIFDEDLGKLAGWGADATNIAASISKGDYIGAAQQSLALIGEIIKANREANKEIQQFNYDLAQQAIGYSLEVIRAVKDIKSETDSIFSTDIGNALTQSMSGYNQAIIHQSGLMNDLANATIKTGVEKRKFMGIVFGTRDVYSNLLQTFPKLIDENGKLNRELAQTLIAGGNLNDETTDLVQNLLDAGDAANEAMQQFEDTLLTLFGQLGDDLKNILDDSFLSGTDSAKRMMDAIGGYLNKMFTADLFHDIFGDDLKKLREGIGSSYDPNNPNADKDVTDDFANFADSIPVLTARYNEALKAWKETMAQNGFDVSEETTRTASSKGIAQASQDSVDELNGRMTAIQAYIYDIRGINQQSFDFEKESAFYDAAMLSQLETIAENTAYCKHLENMDRVLGDIQLKGVKIKT